MTPLPIENEIILRRMKARKCLKTHYVKAVKIQKLKR